MAVEKTFNAVEAIAKSQHSFTNIPISNQKITKVMAKCWSRCWSNYSATKEPYGRE